MNQKVRMLAGELYTPFGDEALQADYKKCKRLLRLFNATTEEETQKREQILTELFGATGENPHIEPPFYCDYGCNVFVGKNFYANYDCIILDENKITIGDNVLLGPRVCIFAAQHPIDPDVRRLGVETSAPVTIGNDVWIGGNTVINPGVHIGNNVIVGSGSVYRKINGEDRRFWKEKLREYRRIC